MKVRTGPRGILARVAPCLWLVVALGCAVNPVTGRRELVLVSERREIEVGRQAAGEVAAELGIVDHPSLSEYVSAVGRRVASHSPRRGLDYTFAIVDRDVPNAFTLPGGHIFVSRGLLAIANDEAELAGVLAHEIVHAAARHHVQRHARATGVGLLVLPGLLAGEVIGGPLGDLMQAPFAVVGGGLIARYSRDQEREADRVGQEIAAAAGYDPRAMADFLAILERDTRLRRGSPRIPGFFDTHPSTPERLTEAAAHARAIAFTPRAGVAGDRAAFLGQLEGLLVGADPAEGVFQGRRFLQADLDFTLVFPDGWKTANTRDAVGALSPERDAQVLLQVQGPGDDPRVAASIFFDESAEQMRVDVARLEGREIAGLPAVHGLAVAKSGGETLILHLTWIAHRGWIHRIAGVVEDDYDARHDAAFDAVAGSFRPLRPDERDGIREMRIRVATALAGETLGELGRRVGNAWDPKRTAVANALDEDATLAGGERVKVAESRRYPGRPPAAQ